MSFDQDPNEQANISGADFAQMCDEIELLKKQRDELRAAIETVCEGWTLPDGARKTLEAALHEAIYRVKGGA